MSGYSTNPSTPLLHRSRSLRPVHSEHSPLLAKIKSLQRIELRSPILSRPPPPAEENSSVETQDTPRSFTSRIFSSSPDLQNIKSYYDDFTTIDWANAFGQINLFNFFLKKGYAAPSIKPMDSSTFELPKPLSVLQKAYLSLGQWVLIVIIAFIFAIIAYTIDKFEILLVGFKYGYCSSNWFASEVSCCAHHEELPDSSCPNWRLWSQVFTTNPFKTPLRYDYVVYILLTILLAVLAGLITLTTKIPSRLSSLTFSPSKKSTYTGAGSGVPEVKTILSGFVIRRFLGSYTLFAKTIALILAIASGMSLGKEGPYVHLATCVGNVMTRLFPFINNNDILKKQILSASASSGVALAFGSPLGGVLFILEEINHYLPSNQLFLIFICAITSTLFLKFLNPYGTGKTVLFELNYTSDWSPAELPFFVIIGIVGGIFGASFIKFTKWWSNSFRQLHFIKRHPILDVLFVSLLTGAITFWNPYLKQASSELVLVLATSCSADELDSSLCPTNQNQFIRELWSLIIAFVIKVLLTFITFGLKVPSGIYVPSMVAGALFGRIFGMVIQLSRHRFNQEYNIMNYICADSPDKCVDLGIYAMISAGAFMAGVTRMNITLVTILFELTSSYTYVLPIAIAIAVANWLGGLLEENSLYECLLIANDYPFLSPESDAVDPHVSAGDIMSDDDTCKASEEQETVQRGRCLDHAIQEKIHIDITDSPYVSSDILRSKLDALLEKSLLDGCIPLIKNKICVGTMYYSTLEFCLDRLETFGLEFGTDAPFYCKVYSASSYSEHSLRVYKAHNSKVLSDALETLRSHLRPSETDGDYFNHFSASDYRQMEQENEQYHSHLNNLTNISDHVNRAPICISHDAPLYLAHLIFDKIGTRVIVLQKEGHYYGVLHKKIVVDFCRRGE